MQTFELVVLPEEAASESVVQHIVAKKFGNNRLFRITKRSIDARSKIVKIRLQLQWIDEQNQKSLPENRMWQNVANSQPVIIAGCGPAGLFAAIRLIECGYKPIIIERGKDLRNRRRDLAAINKQRQINPESNYCFGEGGAGTYSDGKLYTRSNKRGNIASVLNTFIEHGAAADIAVDAHPHIGTNKLPAIISAMRNRIVESGGEVLFNTKLIKIDFDLSGVNGVEVQQGLS
ncbi:MAG: FAD-binding protein, partial [Bacteroidetes bacterium]|nr:FAD-binding protein [Bacteroidota bacterium]